MENVVSININGNSSNKLSRPKGGTKFEKKSLGSLSAYYLNGLNLPKVMDEGIYSFNTGLYEYDFLYTPSDHNRLFVFLSGDAQRKKYTPPVFQRWSWSTIFPGHCLCIADPTVKLTEDLGLCWYIGDQKESVLPTIEKIIKSVAINNNIPFQNVILYASSGGGFAALQLSALIPEVISIPINPQVDVTKYHRKNVEKFLKRHFTNISREEALENYRERFSVIPHSEKLRNNRIIYVQNRLDLHHYNDHFPLFAKSVGLNNSNDYNNGNIESVFFDHPKGHGVPEPTEVIEVLLEKVINMTS